jgi:hypothetical protein
MLPIGNSMPEYFKQWAQNLTHPSEIAKVILQAVTSDNLKILEYRDCIFTLTFPPVNPPNVPTFHQDKTREKHDRIYQKNFKYGT